MSELKKIIANNLTELRKHHNLTQAELANKLDYSDKSISKWERAEALPDIENLVRICELYNVSLDYLTKEHQEINLNKKIEINDRTNKMIISCLSIFTSFTLIMALFIVLKITMNIFMWQLFIYNVPIALVLCIIFNAIWGKRKYNFLFITLLMWSLIVCVYLGLFQYNLWYIFFLGIPPQVIIFLWSQLKITKHERF